MRLALATGNSHKVREIIQMLSGLPVEIITHADRPGFIPPEETEATFLENAALKAVAFGTAVGLPCVADDSGLEVDCLDGRPGVHSARYAGPGCDYNANNEKLLKILTGIPPSSRGGTFRCIIALFDPGNRIRAVGHKRVRVGGQLVYVFQGTVSGVIAPEPRGTEGFGYDPVFIWPPAGSTFAELSPEVKNAVSHRGRALKELTSFLRKAEIA